MAIEILPSDAIEEALKANRRQYLLGDLKKPQDLSEIFDKNAEAGISKYELNTTDAPHFHTVSTEYQYVLSGMAEYRDLDSNQVYRVSQGDFFIIRPYTKYYQKSSAGTKILFFKVPAGNDKVETSLTAEQRSWGEDYEF
ncbi:MAG: cupin domain-containing protein [Clostridiaceae bacterium]|nr:cupin domain-containing protein [Clostridiaceae bacterium]